jgi:hypothetical protein
MRKCFFTVVFLAFCPLLVAQQALNNDSIIKLVKAGLSEDLIVTTINAAPGTYDISADGLIALKTAGVSDKVVAAIVAKTSAFALPTPPPVAPAPGTELQPSTAIPGAETQGPGQALPQPWQPPSKPRVFLQSASKGNQWSAARDQTMEMSKDFEKDCPDVRITINQQVADYTVVLNHIEFGFSRDNQFQIANKDGDLISKTKEGGSIDGGVKKACRIILDDWAKGGGPPR